MRQRGYSLAELLLVVAILMVLTALVVARAGTSIQTRTLNKDGSALISILRHARATAVAHSTRTNVFLDTTENTAQLKMLEDPLEDLENYVEAPGRLGDIIHFDEEVEIEAENRETGELLSEIVYFQDGVCGPVDIRLSHPKVQDTLLITIDHLTGIAQITEELE